MKHEPLTILSPVDLVSYDTLIAVGFSEEKANRLWAAWIQWDCDPSERRNRGSKPAFYDFFTGGLDVDAREPATTSDEDWRASLNHYGIGYEAQEAIMDPEFKYHRLSRSLRHWIKETIDIRYAWLRRRQDTSESSETLAMLTTSSHRKTTARVLDVFSYLRGTRRYLRMFKAVSLAQTHRSLNEKGNVDFLGKLRSPAASDFSGVSEAIYFNQDFHVAEVDAAYMKRRSPRSQVVILSVKISSQILTEVQGHNALCTHWPSPRWKELVWRGRSGRTLAHSTEDLCRFWKALFITGTMAHQPNTAFNTMMSAAEVTEDCVYMFEGSDGLRKPAVQFMFAAGEGERLLKKNGEFKIEKRL